MVNCPICNKTYSKDSYISTYTAPFNSINYKLYHCLNCDLQWWEPLKIVPEFYENEGNFAYKEFHEGLKRNLGENHLMFVKSDAEKKGKLLDIGCGDCLFLQRISDLYDLDLYGIDFDKHSIKTCKEKRGIDKSFAVSPFEFFEYTKKNNIKFDIITLFEVLEHQDKPIEFLNTVRNMLKENGYIAGTVPNRESWIVYKDGSLKDNWDMPPNHLLKFSILSLKHLIEKSDFKIRKIKVSNFSLSKKIKFAISKLKGEVPSYIKPQGKYIYFEAYKL